MRCTSPISASSGKPTARGSPRPAWRWAPRPTWRPSGSPVPPADHRVDVYALGCTLYEMLAGRPPFGGAEFAPLFFQHVNSPPPPLSAVRPDLPAALDEVVDRSLAKDPDARYRSAGELAAHAEAALDGARSTRRRAAAPPPIDERPTAAPTTVDVPPPPEGVTDVVPPPSTRRRGGPGSRAGERPPRPSPPPWSSSAARPHRLDRPTSRWKARARPARERSPRTSGPGRPPCPASPPCRRA